jgi:hypothetical protein
MTCQQRITAAPRAVKSPSAFRTLHKAMPHRPLECGDFSPLSCFPEASGIHSRRFPKSGEKSPHSKSGRTLNGRRLWNRQEFRQLPGLE